MKIFALGDPHLSFGRPKPMDIFGELWRDHAQKIATAWDAAVCPQDVVLVPGDISWAHSLAEARPDLEFLAARPGRLKLLLRGNHDSWWHSANKVRAALPPTLAILNNDALRIEEGVVLCGARGWNAPNYTWADPVVDPPIYLRELQRLDLSLAAAQGIRQPQDALLALLHYPPFGPDGTPRDVMDRLERAGVGLAVYGHLHDEDHAWAPRGRHGALILRFVASDFVTFAPQPVYDSARGWIESGS